MIQTFRTKAHERFQELGMPKPKQEAFQYIPQAKLAIPPSCQKPLSCPRFERIPGFNPLVFVDGYFFPEASDLPSDLVCLPLEAAFLSYGSFLQTRWMRSLKEETDPFAALNAASHGGGAFLYAPPHSKSRLHIVHIFTQDGFSAPRLHITLGRSAEMEIVQTTSSQTSHYFHSGALDLALDAGSTVRMQEFQLLPSTARSFFYCRATLKRDANLDILSITDGASVQRSAYSIELAEENTNLLLRQLAMLEGDRQSHFHALVDHAAESCTSRQHVKAVLHGASRSSFDGKILVRPLAQKTMAYQLNNNLLLSDTAVANSKPNLEIFADDVKASHGSTTAELSEEELFYMRSRGLSKSSARALLTHGFCRELIDAVTLEPFRTQILSLMHKVLGHA